MLVIVACPKCHKQYRLDTSRLVYSQLPDKSNMGVQLACSNCHEQWWEVKKETANINQPSTQAAVPEQPFRNLTDISLLYNYQGTNYTYQEPASHFIARGEERLLQQPVKAPENQPLPKQTGWQQVVKILLMSTLLFSSIIGLALFTMGYKLPSWQAVLMRQSTPAMPGKIIIENIRFKVKALDEHDQRVIVVATVKNSTPLPIALKDLEITALGTCTEGKTPNAQGLCKIRTWSYKWAEDRRVQNRMKQDLQPGERLAFKSIAKVPANTSIGQVNVALPSND